jgi:ribosomal protein L4
MLIKASKVRKMALEMAKATRTDRFTRVSKTFLNDVETRTRQAISQLIGAHPDNGKTLMGRKS